MTVLVGVLVAVAVVGLVVWWLADFEMPEVMIPAVAPGAGIAFIYWYGTPLAWALGIALFILAAGVAIFLIRRSGGGKDKPPE